MTVKEIAKHCNVSPSTVSNILNDKPNVSEKTRQKVLDYVKMTGYQPNYFAQSIRKQKSQVLSIIAEDLMAFGTVQIVESIMAYCEDHHYRTVLINLRLYDKWQDAWYDDKEKLEEALAPAIQESLSIKVDGIIYVAGHCRLLNLFPPNLPIPVVAAYGMSNGKNPSIIIDDEKGGHDITAYLLEKGHKKIGVIAGAVDNMHTQMRLLGYQNALFESGILYDPSLIRYADWRRESAYPEVAPLLEKDITAMFCMNDEMAAGACDYLHDHNIAIGHDISVAGYDNNTISDYLRPRLTTVEIQLTEIGIKSAEVMLQVLAGATEATGTLFKIPCRMIERDSVEALPST